MTDNKYHEINGKLAHMGTTDDKGKFKMRNMRIEIEGKYPQLISFDLFNENTELLDNLSLGDYVDVKFNIRGREYQGRYYNSLIAFSVICSHHNTDDF